MLHYYSFLDVIINNNRESNRVINNPNSSRQGLEGYEKSYRDDDYHHQRSNYNHKDDSKYHNNM